MALNKSKTFRFDSQELEMFERLYPELLPLFVQRAVRLAINSRPDFEKIFFSDFVTLKKEF